MGNWRNLPAVLYSSLSPTPRNPAGNVQVFVAHPGVYSSYHFIPSQLPTLVQFTDKVILIYEEHKTRMGLLVWPV